MHTSFLKRKNKPTDGSGNHLELVLHPEHIDDLALWQAFRAGDERALITIFDRFTKPLYSYGFKIVGESEMVKDAVQELFIELWQNRTRLGDTDSIKFYLFKSLRRKLLRTKAKSENRFFARLTIAHDKETSPSRESVMIAEQKSSEKREKVVAMLDKLTKRQREALFLRYFEELSCDQIASVMELSKQAVYNLIHHGLDQLKAEGKG